MAEALMYLSLRRSVSICERFRVEAANYLHPIALSGFPLWLEKWEGIFKSGNFEQTGKVRENHTKYLKSHCFTARKRSLRRSCFHRCLSVPACTGQGGVCLGGGVADTPWVQRQTPPLPGPEANNTPCPSGYYGMQQAYGTHPTGMHSCYLSFLVIIKWTVYYFVKWGKFLVKKQNFKNTGIWEQK